MRDIERFWVFDWFETLDIKSERDIVEALHDPVIYQEFIEDARRIGLREPQIPSSSVGIVAGAGIALSGRGACSTPECRRKQVDNLLRHVWHYFDYIIVDDLTEAIAAEPPLSTWEVVGWLSGLLYLGQIGAESLVQFGAPIDVSAASIDSTSDEETSFVLTSALGFDLTAVQFESFVSYLTEGAKVLTMPSERAENCLIRLAGPTFDNTFLLGWELSNEWYREQSEAYLIHRLGHRNANWIIKSAMQGIAASRVFGVPLGSASKPHRETGHHPNCDKWDPHASSESSGISQGQEPSI